MEASLITRSFIKPANRHLINTIILSKQQQPFTISRHTTLSTTSLFNPPSFQSIYTTPVSLNHVASIISDQNDTSFIWKFASNGEDKKPVVTVVVLGWLGSKQAHLRRYAEMYSMFGVNVVTCAVSVEGTIGFDLGRTLESRVVALCDEIVEWAEGKEDDGRERLLMFHTFSNTGWLGYGYILNILQGRDELREKIIGCVVDSGGDPELNPKVWATGFTKAILTKKQNSAVNISEAREVQNGTKFVNIEEKEPSFTEVLLMTIFKMFFTLFLLIPDVKTRVIKVTTTLSWNQPNHPQLYLYSTIDQVVPFQKIELFVEHQKKQGRKVTTFNFKSSSHLDHHRRFPYIYRSLIQDFMKECLAAKDKQLCNLVR
ncbi:transmembrane protein 53 [Tanacetum coccineum]